MCLYSWHRIQPLSTAHRQLLQGAETLPSTHPESLAASLTIWNNAPPPPESGAGGTSLAVFCTLLESPAEADVHVYLNSKQADDDTGIRSLAIPWCTGLWDGTPSVSKVPGSHLAPQSPVSASSPPAGDLPSISRRSSTPLNLLLISLPLCLGCEVLQEGTTPPITSALYAVIDIILRNNYVPSLH